MTRSTPLTGADGAPLSPADVRQWAETGGCLLSFGEQATGFCDRLSDRLMRHPLLGRESDVVALAFWLRRAALSKMTAAIIARTPPDILRVPRGLAFHLPPSNVDTVFVYSWALSFLAGNRNLVRVSRRANPLAAALCRELTSALQASDDPDVRSNSLFISYDHDDGLTTLFSEMCALRVIWGGDDTVSHVRRLPLPPLATEVVFASRTSLCVLSAAAVDALDDGGLSRLAADIFNDAFTFDQMACSSPRKLIWTGSAETTARVQARLYPALTTIAARRGYEPATSVVLQKMTLAAGSLVDGQSIRTEHFGNALTIVTLASADADLSDFCGGGLLMSLRIDQPEDLIPLMRRREQTLTVFGLTAGELRGLVLTSGPDCVDRIVPVGQALSFSHHWDGLDLAESFSRQVHLAIA